MVFIKHSDEVRMCAVELVQLGWDMELVATTPKVSKDSLKRWVARYNANDGSFTLDYTLSARILKLAAHMVKL